MEDYELDISNFSQGKEVVSQIVERFGRIDALFNNAGIALATIAAAKGMSFQPYLEPGVTIERKQIFDAFGLNQHEFDEILGINLDEGLVLDDLVAGMNQIADENDFYYINQTLNEVNQEAHYKTTGPEIWRDTDGEVDILVAMGGTAGTIVGTGRYLKEKNPNIKVVGVQAHPHSRPEDAYKTAKELTRTGGIFLGTSAAAALTAARILAERPENEGKNIVVIFADNGMKYLSTDLYK